jgi:hypothetical protein
MLFTPLTPHHTLLIALMTSHLLRIGSWRQGSGQVEGRRLFPWPYSPIAAGRERRRQVRRR